MENEEILEYNENSLNKGTIIMEKEKRLKCIKDDLKKSSKILNAICDENRQKILLVLLENCADGGIRVTDIAEKINLSRPAVSHHLKLLLDENIVSINKVGTKNYYHISGMSEIMSLKSLFNNIELYINERKEELNQ